MRKKRKIRKLESLEKRILNNTINSLNKITDINEFMRRAYKVREHFVTEAIFKNGRRADIINLDDFEIIEILCSETEEQFDKKIKYYPEEFIIVKVNANQKFKKELIY